MGQSFFWAACGTLFTFAMTALGAAAVFFVGSGKALQKPMCGFAAGVMTAASVWSLLLPAIEQAERSPLPAYLPAAAGLALGSLFLGVLDGLLPRLAHRPQTDAEHRCALLFSAITLHNIPEGMAVGLACALGAGGGEPFAAAALALGIGIQNFPEGAAVSLPLLELGRGKGRACALGALSGAVEPIFGLLVVYAAAAVHSLMPWFLSFAAGAMLYVVADELVPQAQGKSGTVGFMTGFLFMMVLDVALG